MNPEKLPQNQNNDRYDFSDLLPAEQQPESQVDQGLDELETKVTAAENHHKNEVERQERQEKLETVRRQLSEFSATGAGPTEILDAAKSLVVGVPTRNKYGIVAMADTPKAKTGESAPAATTEEPKAGEAASDDGESTPAAPTPAKRTSAWRHPIKAWREKADELLDERDAREEAAAKAAEEAAERDKNLIDADENPTRFTAPAKLTRAQRKELAANTKAAQKEQQEREKAARMAGTSAADVVRPLPDEKKPVVVKVEAPDPDEAAEEAKTEPEATPTAKPAPKPATKAKAAAAPAASTPDSTGAPTPAQRSAEIAAYRAKAREAARRGTDTDTDTEATTTDSGFTESSAVLSSTVPGQRAPEASPKPIVGSAEGGNVSLSDLYDLDSLLGEQPSVTVTEEDDGEGDTEKTQPIGTIEADDGSSLGALKGALDRGEAASEEEGESPRRAGRIRRIGALATRFMDSRLMTGRWRDASPEDREERQNREEAARQDRRNRQLARDTEATPSAWLGLVDTEGAPDDPDNPDNGDDDDENAPATARTDESKNAEPDNGDGGNPDDPNSSTSEGTPERRRVSRRTRRLASLALAGALLAGGAAASAEFAPGPRVSASEQGHDHAKDDKAAEKQEKERTDKKEAGANPDADTSTGSSDAELPPKSGNTVTTPDTTQNETDTVEKKSDTDVVVTLKSGGTIYQSGIDAGLNASEVMNAVNNAHITDAMARGMQVGQQIDFHKSDNGEWTVKLR